MEKERIELLKAYLREIAENETRVVEAIRLWKEGDFKKVLKEGGLEDATVEDISAVLKSGDIDTSVLERTNSSCDIESPTSQGNCVA